MDRISRLPDGLIIDILSLLSDKEVKATSVLSKNWLRITDSITVDLSFNDSHISSTDFPSFVHRVLHRGTTNLQSVTLHLKTVYDADDTQLWIRVMEARNVKRIYLFLRNCCVLIPKLFTCSTIEVLYVNGLVRLVLPPVINLPCLKILNLELEDIDFGTVPKLLSGCLALEELNLALVYSRCNGNLIIQSCRLRKFGLRFYGVSGFRTIIDELHLDSPALEFLDVSFISKVLQIHLVCTMPSLSEIKFAANCMAAWMLNASAVTRMMALHHVKNLSLCFSTLEALFLGIMVEDPRFPNVTKLVVGVRLNFVPLMWLLARTPNLEELVFTLVDKDLTTCWRINELDGPRPQCLITSLRAIEFCNFRGTAIEMKMAKYLLRYGARLQTMRISTFKSGTAAAHNTGRFATIDNLINDLIMQDLSSTPPASAALELIIS